MKQTLVQQGISGLETWIAEVAQSPRRPLIAGALSGVVSGIAFGAITGPVGGVLAMWIGVGVGLITGHALQREHATESVRTKELDAIIGITRGSMGVDGAVKAISFPPASLDASAMSGWEGVDDDGPAPYSTREAWVSEWLTPPPPCVG